MNRQTLNLILLLLGFALPAITINGSYRWFVSPAMFWPLVLAGAVVLALAAVDIARDLGAHTRSQPADDTGHPAEDHHDHHDSHDHHDHVHCHPALVWGVTVPVLLLLFVGPGPISARGADSALSGSSVSVVDGSARIALSPLPDTPRPEIGFLDLTRRAAVDSNHSVDDREVIVVGTVLRDAGQTRIGRVVITCCAADARLISVRVDDEESLRRLAVVPDGSWVRGVVRVIPGTTTADNGYVPQVRVIEAEGVEAPPRPYEIPAGR